MVREQAKQYKQAAHKIYPRWENRRHSFRLSMFWLFWRKSQWRRDGKA